MSSILTTIYMIVNIYIQLQFFMYYQLLTLLNNYILKIYENI